jgi:Transmembrane secretion effector
MSVPLRRNRDFILLQTGQALSTIGSEASAVAYTLLVLELTDSAALAGLVGFARIFPYALFALPAGVAVDRMNRKRLMVVSDLVRVVVVGGLGVLVATGHVTYAVIPVVAFIEGTMTRVAVRRRRHLIRLLIRHAGRDAHALPGGASAVDHIAARGGSRRAGLALAPEVPAHVRDPLRRLELFLRRAATHARGRRARPGIERRCDRRTDRRYGCARAPRLVRPTAVLPPVLAAPP